VELKCHAFSSLAQDEGKVWVHTRYKCCTVKVKEVKHVQNCKMWYATGERRGTNYTCPHCLGNLDCN
jgi:hypothetical protein